jgi:DNA-binding LacI/PurR family transcriptional regulator
MTDKVKPTAKQVAHAVGVSVSAVSRAFMPGSSLGAGKKQAILEAAARLGYVSPARRTAEAVASGTVTLVAGDLANPFYPMVLDSLARHLQRRDRRLLVYALPGQEQIDAMTPQILTARPSALVVTSARLTSGMADACRRQGIRIVLLNRIQRDIRLNAVACDNYLGGRDAALHLLAKGRRRIAFVEGIANTSTHEERQRGFLDTLRDAGVGLHGRAPGGFDYQMAHGAVSGLLSERIAPDALFCCNDIMALAAIDAAKAKGLRVPDDIAVVGFDDIPMAAWNSYSLTTIRQPVERMIDETIRLLDEMTGMPGDEGTTRILPGELVERGST